MSPDPGAGEGGYSPEAWRYCLNLDAEELVQGGVVSCKTVLENLLF